MRSRRWTAPRPRTCAGSGRAQDGAAREPGELGGQGRRRGRGRRDGRAGLAPVARRQRERLVDAEAGVCRAGPVGQQREVAVLPVGPVDGDVDIDRRTVRSEPGEHPVGAGLQRGATVVRVGLEIWPRGGARRRHHLTPRSRVECHVAQGRCTDGHARRDGHRGAYERPSAPAGPAPVDQADHVGRGHGAQLGLEAEGRPQLLVEAHAPPASWTTPDAASARRSAAMAAEDCDFTVPGAQPIVCAICASDMSS